jgi:glycosyltransferase involved in cell wall biosynthesis
LRQSIKTYYLFKPLHIAILGCRGIPNHYGGFEQLAEHLSKGLVEHGHTVSVYNTHDHPYQDKVWENVEIIHCNNPEKKLGTAGQFLYDRNCILDARGRNFDVVLFLGYTSSSVWGRWFPRSVIISNMDGLEWKRSKYSLPVRWFLRRAEAMAIRYSHFFVADSPLIQDRLQQQYAVSSKYIAYGASQYEQYDTTVLQQFGLSARDYDMLMARMEPENNVEMILKGFTATGASRRLLVVGNMQNAFGKKMISRFGHDKRLVFAGPIFDQAVNHSLRHYCSLYFHGHSVGGTNPSLLEAMSDGALIAAHDNGFNRAVLGDDAFYFSTAADVSSIVQTQSGNEEMTERNKARIQEQYNWPHIIAQYATFIEHCYNRKKR